jgi:hypothetical protein
MGFDFEGDHVIINNPPHALATALPYQSINTGCGPLFERNTRHEHAMWDIFFTGYEALISRDNIG